MYTVFLAASLCYIVLYQLISELISAEVQSYTHILLILVFISLETILPIYWYIKTKRWTILHNERVQNTVFCE